MKRKYGVVDYLRKHYPPPEGSGEVEVEFLEGYDSIEGPDGSIGFGFGGGGGPQSMKKEGQKAPSIDDLKEAGSEEEFKARLKEGQAFRLKEKAGFHVISIDENRPPLVQVIGDSDLIAQMLAFAISEIIESSVKNGVQREQAEGMFRIALELGIATSRN